MIFDGISAWYIQSFPVTLNNKILQYIENLYRADILLFLWMLKNVKIPYDLDLCQGQMSSISHIFLNIFIIVWSYDRISTH